jgi:hypothetical protein
LAAAKGVMPSIWESGYVMVPGWNKVLK